MIYKKQSRRRLHLTKNKKGGGQQLSISYLDNGTPFWYWSGDTNMSTTKVFNWTQSSLNNGLPFWYDADNSLNPISFENPFALNTRAAVNPVIDTLPQDDNPPVVVITGSTQSGPDMSNWEFGGIFDRTDEIYNGYPVYADRITAKTKEYNYNCLVYDIAQNGFESWLIMDAQFRPDYNDGASAAFIPGECGGLANCTSSVWHKLLDDEWVEQPDIKMLIGAEAEKYIQNNPHPPLIWTKKILDDGRDYWHVLKNGGRRSVTKQIRKRSVTKQIRKRRQSRK